jgi:hypothetical protein
MKLEIVKIMWLGDNSVDKTDWFVDNQCNFFTSFEKTYPQFEGMPYTVVMHSQPVFPQLKPMILIEFIGLSQKPRYLLLLSGIYINACT